jgi:hypothetical protein
MSVMIASSMLTWRGQSPGEGADVVTAEIEPV